MIMKKKYAFSVMLCLCLASASILSACNSSITNTSSTSGTSSVSEGSGTSEASKTSDGSGVSTASSEAADGIDYMALVNKTHKLPDDWEEHLETVHITNSVGDDVEVEKTLALWNES